MFVAPLCAPFAPLVVAPRPRHPTPLNRQTICHPSPVTPAAPEPPVSAAGRFFRRRPGDVLQPRMGGRCSAAVCSLVRRSRGTGRAGREEEGWGEVSGSAAGGKRGGGALINGCYLVELTQQAPPTGRTGSGTEPKPVYEGCVMEDYKWQQARRSIRQSDPNRNYRNPRNAEEESEYLLHFSGQ